MKRFKIDVLKIFFPLLALAVLFGVLNIQKIVRPRINDKTIIVRESVLKSDIEKDEALKVAKAETVNFSEPLDNIIGYLDNRDLLVAMNHMLYTGNIANPKFKVYDENFAFKQIIEVSKNSRRIMYLDSKDTVSVYDIKTKKQVNLIKPSNENGEDIGLKFLNENGDYLALYDLKKNEVTVVNCQTAETKLIQLSSKQLASSFLYSVDGINIYSMLKDKDPEDKNVNTGLYILNSQKPELIVKVFDSANISQMSTLDSGRMLIFSGNYIKESGVFVYDTENRIISKIISGGKDSEGLWCPDFTLSPDKTKIVYSQFPASNGTMEYYLGDFNGSEITSKAFLTEDRLDSVIDLCSHWRGDGRSIFIEKADGRSLSSSQQLKYKLITIFDIK